jgi:hypothetical protein
MPRHYRSEEDAGIASLLQRLDNATDSECRTLLSLLIHDSQEARDACNRVFGEEAFNYFDTEIHSMIVEGTATRSDIQNCIEDSNNLDLDTQIEMLVAIGTDLVVHHLRWSSDELDTLHGKIQEYLMDLLKWDPSLVDSLWKSMDQLVADEGRYSVLAAKLKEDKRQEEQT